MKTVSCVLLNLLVISTYAFSLPNNKNINVMNLRTEYAETPLGIDVSQPRFSWQMVSDKLSNSSKAGFIYGANDNRLMDRNKNIYKLELDTTSKITYAKGYYDSMYGRIESSWEIKGNTCNYRFVVPANTMATVYISVSSEKEVIESGKEASKSSSIEFLRIEKGKAIFELESGEYRFLAKFENI